MDTGLIENPAFFQHVREVSGTAYHRLAELILREFPDVRGVVDVGCGPGNLLYGLHELAMDIHVMGLDGSRAAIESAFEEIRAVIHRFDLRSKKPPPRPEWRVDLVVCTEVLEHIDPKWEDHVLDHLCSYNPRVIVFSAAVPGQRGVHHVNLKPQVYWMGKLRGRGYEHVKDVTDRVRRDLVDYSAEATWIANNVMVYSEAKEIRLEDFDPAGQSPRTDASGSRSAVALSARRGVYQRRLNHWCRMAMDDDTARFVSSLDYENMEAVEISGSAWANVPFRSYRSTDYPSFDIVRDQPLRADLIICEQVLEHVDLPWVACKNLFSGLRPNGWVLVTVPMLLRYHPAPLDCTRWSSQGLKHMLEYAGFTDVKTASWGNKPALLANLENWTPYEEQFDLRNDPRYPLVTWGWGRRPES